MFTTEKRREGTIVFLLRHQRQYPLLTTPESTESCFLGEDYSSHSAIFKENFIRIDLHLRLFHLMPDKSESQGKSQSPGTLFQAHCHPIKTLCHAFCWAFPSPPRIIFSGGPT